MSLLETHEVNFTQSLMNHIYCVVPSKKEMFFVQNLFLLCLQEVSMVCQDIENKIF